MTEFFDFALAPLRKFLGPVYDAYRKKYEYPETAVVPGHFVGTIEGVPLPDFIEDRQNNFYYSVYGRPDNMVRADIVGNDTVIKMQSKPQPPTFPRGEIVRPVDWLPEKLEMQEIFVEMPFSQKTKYNSSTVATRHG
jgi:hypothetical protein